MDEGILRLQGKLGETCEKLENFTPSTHHVNSLKGDLQELLGILASFTSKDIELER